LLIATFDRRVKNLLARVAAVAKAMRHGNDSLDEYIQALDRRIQSMSDAHSLLSQNRSNGVDLAELVRRQLVPDGPDANTRLSGPNIALPVAVTQTLAMVLNELATNAAKYGALSTPHGRVEVNWNRGPGEDELVMARDRRARRCNFARLQVQRQHHSQSHPARARRFGRPCIRIRRRLLQN
jgi:two-component sensor histidine kinase